MICNENVMFIKLSSLHCLNVKFMFTCYAGWTQLRRRRLSDLLAPGRLLVVNYYYFFVVNLVALVEFIFPAHGYISRPTMHYSINIIINERFNTITSVLSNYCQPLTIMIWVAAKVLWKDEWRKGYINSKSKRPKRIFFLTIWFRDIIFQTIFFRKP